MRLQGAIFDMDGTLLDSMPAWYDLTAGILREEMGLPPDEELEHTIRTGDLSRGSALLRSRYGVSCTPAEMTAMGDARMDRFYREQVVPKPDVEKLLSILKMEGVWMYVATATNRPLAEAGLRRTGLDRYFRGILTCAEAGKGKEDPLIFEKCLTRLRCQKRDCVVFEDSLYAIRTAKAAGFRTAGVYDACSEGDQPEIRALADYYISSYGEWLEQL